MQDFAIERAAEGWLAIQSSPDRKILHKWRSGDSLNRKILHEKRRSACEICPSGQNLLVRAAPFAMMEGTEIQGGRCDDKR